MSEAFLWIVSVLYLGAATGFLLEGKIPLATTFLAYAIANIALIYAAR